MTLRADMKVDGTEALTHATKKAGDVVDDGREALKAVTSPVSEAFGLATDAIAELRRRWIGQMKLKTDRILADRGVDAPRPLPASAIPELNEATFGESDELRDLWAGLVADARDPSKPSYTPAFGKVLNEFGPAETRAFIAAATLTKRQVVGGKEAYDDGVAALQIGLTDNERENEVRALWNRHITAATRVGSRNIGEEAGLNEAELLDALAALLRLHVLQPAILGGSSGWGGWVRVPASVRPAELKLTDFGRTLYRRCTGDDTELSPLRRERDSGTEVEDDE